MELQNNIYQSFYVLTLALCVLLCLMPGCKMPQDNAPDTDVETEETTEVPPQTPEETTDTPTETEETVETPTQPQQETVQTPTEASEGENEDVTQTSEILYKKDTMVLVQSGDYLYLAKVTKNTDTTAKKVPTHIFVPHIREKIGQTIPIEQVWSKRKIPEDGWGTRLVAIEYFENLEWTFQWNVREMEDHYLLPTEEDTAQRIEFAAVRFPVPKRK